MNFESFLSTIYLGDRACKSILIDGWNGRVEVTVDIVSRIRDRSGNWNFYADEDVHNGQIVFAGVEAIIIEPPGRFPNDVIESLVVEQVTNEGIGHFKLTANQVIEDGEAFLVVVRIAAKDLYLVDPRNSGMQLRT